MAVLHHKAQELRKNIYVNNNIPFSGYLVHFLITFASSKIYYNM